MNTRELLNMAPVIPVLVIDDPDSAVDLANALVAGGLPVLEITLRTPTAFEAIAAIQSSVQGAKVGAGTVNTIEQLEQCKKHEVDFMVSPGLYTPLVEAAQQAQIPYLPGISNASEALAAINSGLDTLKFFPAQQSGGTAMLQALNGPYGDLRFCPTGGINANNYLEFLELSNVLCVGGSWVAPKQLVAAKDWQAITTLAQNASTRQ